MQQRKANTSFVKRMINYIVLILFLFRPTHDFHTSWLNITYDKVKKEFNSSWHTDTEHLEAVLSSFSSNEVHLETNLTDDQKRLLQDYLSANYSISINGKKSAITVATVEVNFAETFIHLSPQKHKKKISTITVKNQLLVEQFPNQKNMVQINYEGKKYSMLMNSQKTEGSIYFH